MSTHSTLPLAASRLLVRVGYLLTALLAIVLLVVAILLALAWPAVLAEAVEAGLELKTADLQPWVSLVLLGGATILALAARMFHRLGTILKAVVDGDPFTTDNSRRLRHIGWLMIAMQLVGMLTGWVGSNLPAQSDFSTGFEFSFSGFLAALLAFVVAQLFEQARAMRDDLAGTV
jgi:uncharacterized membrane protein